MMTPVAFVLYVLEIAGVVLWTAKWPLPLRVLLLAALLIVTGTFFEWLILTD